MIIPEATSKGNAHSNSWLNPYRELDSRIKALAQKTFEPNADTADLKQAYRVAHSWTWHASGMRQTLSTLPAESIETFLCSIAAEGSEKEFYTYLHYCLNCLSKDASVDLSGFTEKETAANSFANHGFARDLALSSYFDKEKRILWKEFLVEFKYFLHEVLGVLIATSGLNEITRQKHNKFSDLGSMNTYAAVSKLESYKNIFFYPVALFGIIYSYVAFQLTAALITAAFVTASLVALIAYRRYGQPCPIDHAGLKNLNIELLSDHEPVYIRFDILKKVTDAFESGKGAILVGEPGDGKTLISYALAQLALNGEVSPRIKKLQVFAVNGTRFNPTFDGVSFGSIEDAFGKYSNEVALFIDEFHTLFTGDGRFGNPGEEIKTFSQRFKFILGATTQKEFDAHIKKSETIKDRRFDVIQVPPMKDKEIEGVLSEYMECASAAIDFDPAVFSYIAEKASTFKAGTSKVDASLSLLKLALQKMSAFKQTDLEDKVIELKSEQRTLKQRAIQRKAHLSKELRADLEAKQNELAEVQVALEKKAKQIERMKKIEAYYLSLKRQSYKLSNPKQPLAAGSQLEKEWTQLHARISLVDSALSHEKKSLGLSLCLNKELVDSIITERLQDSNN